MEVPKNGKSHDEHLRYHRRVVDGGHAMMDDAPTRPPGCSSDRSSRIHSFEEDIVGRHLAPLIAQARAEGLAIGLSGACDPGDLEVTFHASDWMHVHLERTAHLSEGWNERRGPGFRMDEKIVDRHFSDFIDEACALLRRDDEIVRAGEDPETPGGDHVEIHPLVAHVLKATGVTVKKVLGYQKNRGGGVLHNDYGVDMKQVSLTKGERGVFMSHHLRNRYVQCSVSAMIGESRLSLKQEPNRLMLSIPKVTLPDTVLSALSGMHLDDVVRHPLIDGAPRFRIGEATTWSDGTLVLEIERASMSLTDAWKIPGRKQPPRCVSDRSGQSAGKNDDVRTPGNGTIRYA